MSGYGEQAFSEYEVIVTYNNGLPAPFKFVRYRDFIQVKESGFRGSHDPPSGRIRMKYLRLASLAHSPRDHRKRKTGSACPPSSVIIIGISGGIQPKTLQFEFDADFDEAGHYFSPRRP